MSFIVRRAEEHDASAIEEITLQAFGESLSGDEAIIGALLRREPNFVAQTENRVVGFAGNFITLSALGEKRFEIDLLAVSGAARGRGIGAALAAASIALAKKLDVDMIRTLVASNNGAMQRLCQSLGFKRSEQACALCARSIVKAEDMRDLAAGAARHDAHLVPVNTLAYSGIWLEGRLTQAAICAAHVTAAQQNRSRVGAVIAASDRDTQDLLRKNNYELIGEYAWWCVSPRNG